jgi:L-aspartate oxidase
VGQLFVCGESASTGLHGANRLASNSLLEGLVFGAACGHAAGKALLSSHINPRRVANDVVPKLRTELNLDDVRNSLQHLMARNVGITRSGERLNETVDILEFWGRYVMDKVFDEASGWQLQNMLTLARLTALGARERAESRGVHFRKDFPERNDSDWQLHLTIQRTADGKVRQDRRPVASGVG